MINDSDDAIKYFKDHKKEFIDHVFREKYKGANKVAYFMAGSAGAGKTEFAKSYTENFPLGLAHIDADDLRDLFRPVGYNGKNSNKFQDAATKAMQKIFDYAVHNEYSFIMDATFAYFGAVENIKRVFRKHDYDRVEIIFVYQDPKVAWNFAKIREEKEGRSVPIDDFIKNYFKARENAKKAYQEFANGKYKDRFSITVVIKEYDNTFLPENVYQNVTNIDETIPEEYNEDTLRKELSDDNNAKS